jgi:hypothetical protein
MLKISWLNNLSRTTIVCTLIFVSFIWSVTVYADYSGKTSLSVSSAYSIGLNRWFDTGIDIVNGSVLSISSNGTWRLGTGPRECNANGLSNFPPYNGYLYGTLMGKIGHNGPAFPIGTKYKGHANATGRLFLGNNDSNSSDNSGTINVLIEISKKKKGIVSVPSVYSTGLNKWFDSGIDVKKGSVLSIKSNGTWRLGSGPRACNADGLPNFPLYNGYLYGTLMGKIGHNGTVFSIGTEYSGNAYATGRLFLGNNDGNSDDNSGFIDVSIEIK